LQSSFLSCLWSTGITGMHNHVQPIHVLLLIEVHCVVF
jgi:hypothetical protein